MTYRGIATTVGESAVLRRCESEEAALNVNSVATSDRWIVPARPNDSDVVYCDRRLVKL